MSWQTGPSFAVLQAESTTTIKTTDAVCSNLKAEAHETSLTLEKSKDHPNKKGFFCRALKILGKEWKMQKKQAKSQKKTRNMIKTRKMRVRDCTRKSDKMQNKQTPHERECGAGAERPEPPKSDVAHIQIATIFQITQDDRSLRMTKRGG